MSKVLQKNLKLVDCYIDQTKEHKMPLISRDDFEEMIQRRAEETGLPEETVRKDAEMVAKLNGFQIEEPSTLSLVEHFTKMTMN